MTRIKQLRKILDYTQSRMANELGVARSTVSMWEVSNQEPDYDTLKRITLLYHVPADYVMGRGIFAQWDEIVKYYSEVSFALMEMIPADFMLPVFSDEKYLRAWLDTRLYEKLDELNLIRFFAFSVREISLDPVEHPGEYGPRVDVEVSFTREFTALIRMHDPSSDPKVVRALDAGIALLFDVLDEDDQLFVRKLINTLATDRSEDATSSRLKQLFNGFEQMNPEGQARLLETEDDMIQSGKYIKIDSDRVVQKT